MPTNDDGTGGVNGSNEARMRADGLTLWLVEKRDDGAILSRPVIVTGQVIFGACLDPLPPEAWARCRPLDDPGDGVAAAGKGGA